MSDLTVIYYTSNYITEEFARNIRNVIIGSIGDCPLISVSHKPMDFGQNICVGEIGRSHLNIYRQILIGAKAAKTPYVALVEDDILYPPSHFRIRPTRKDIFTYDTNEWRIYTWVKPPVFGQGGNTVVHQLISGRDYLVDAMEERFRKWPDDSKVNLSDWKDPGRRESRLGVSFRQMEIQPGKDPIVAFSHEDAFGYLNLGNRKPLPHPRCDFLEPWGSAEDVMKLYKRRDESKAIG